MDLEKKLQIPKGKQLFVVNAPKDTALGIQTSNKETYDSAVLVFASDTKTLKTSMKPAIKAAKADRLAWIAYPKAGKLETDLNRDKLREFVEPFGVRSVRLVSIDDTWSAMRFRPSK